MSNWYNLKDKLPWDIEDCALITLCDKCHLIRHEKEDILTYEIINGKRYAILKKDYKCDKCMGSGYLPEYKHVEHGICFQCMGMGVIGTVFSELLKTISAFSYKDVQLRNDYKKILNSISEEKKNNIADRVSFTAHLKSSPFVDPPTDEERAISEAQCREGLINRYKFKKANASRKSLDELFGNLLNINVDNNS